MCSQTVIWAGNDLKKVVSFYLFYPYCRAGCWKPLQLQKKAKAAIKARSLAAVRRPGQRTAFCSALFFNAKMCRPYRYFFLHLSAVYFTPPAQVSIALSQGTEKELQFRRNGNHLKGINFYPE
jgi:hypothetical protein